MKDALNEWTMRQWKLKRYSKLYWIDEASTLEKQQWNIAAARLKSRKINEGRGRTMKEVGSC